MKERFLKAYKEFKRLTWSIARDVLDIQYEMDSDDAKRLHICMEIYNFVRESDDDFVMITEEMVSFLEEKKKWLEEKIQNGELR